MTWARAENATRVAVNSVVFRSSGQNLTTAGAYIEMASLSFNPFSSLSEPLPSADASNADRDGCSASSHGEAV